MALAPDTAAVPRTSEVRVAAVQRTLAPTEVLVEFVLLEPRSYCLAITTHGVQLVPLPGKTRLESLSKRAREELQAGRGPERTASRELYDALLGPVAAHWRGASRLFVVPDGQLHLLPFDTVIAANDQAAGGLSVAVVPSASVLALLRTKAETGVREPRSSLTRDRWCAVRPDDWTWSGGCRSRWERDHRILRRGDAREVTYAASRRGRSAHGGGYSWPAQRRLGGRCRD